MIGGMSQTRVPGNVALDVKPKTFRSGKPGDLVAYIAIVKNLGKQRETWQVDAAVEPDTLGVEVRLSAPTITLNRAQATRYPLTIAVSEGAPAGREVKVRVTLSREGAEPVTVHRFFTVEPSDHRPR